MNAGAQAELDAIIAELNAIIADLEDISWGLRGDFKGVGTEKCADCLENALNQYYYVRRQLRNLDVTGRSYGGGGGGALGSGGIGSR